jgi:hypothetical protein
MVSFKRVTSFSVSLHEGCVVCEAEFDEEADGCLDDIDEDMEADLPAAGFVFTAVADWLFGLTADFVGIVFYLR